MASNTIAAVWRSSVDWGAGLGRSITSPLPLQNSQHNKPLRYLASNGMNHLLSRLITDDWLRINAHDLWGCNEITRYPSLKQAKGVTWCFETVVVCAAHTKLRENCGQHTSLYLHLTSTRWRTPSKKQKSPKRNHEGVEKEKSPQTGHSISHHHHKQRYGKSTTSSVSPDENHEGQHFWQGNPLLSTQPNIVSHGNCILCFSFKLPGKLNWPPNCRHEGKNSEIFSLFTPLTYSDKAKTARCRNAQRRKALPASAKQN